VTSEPSSAPASVLPSITRPNGRLYRPRKISVQIIGLDEAEEVVVFGTEDRERAQALAEREVSVMVDSGYTAVYDHTAWLRSGYQGGEPWFFHDEDKGRFGLVFAIEERPEPSENAPGGCPCGHEWLRHGPEAGGCIECRCQVVAPSENAPAVPRETS
jgi:hypothetical protein